MTIKVTTIGQGLRVATDTMTEAESVVLGVWVGAGTRDEPWRSNGIAHLTEHMMFKGTRKRSAYGLSTAVEKEGGSMNAHTTREETAYYARVLPEHVPSSLEIVADMIQHSSFKTQELKRERQVILQEIGRDIDSPEDHIFDLINQIVFPLQRIGRPILGSAEVISRMPRSAITKYVNEHYHAENMILTAAGKIEHEEFVALAKKNFSKLEKKSKTRREKIKNKSGSLYNNRNNEQLHLILAFGAEGIHHPSLYSTQLLSIILGGSSSSRLFQNIREKRGLVYTISSSHVAYTDGGLFQIYAGTDPLRVHELVPSVAKEMANVAEKILPGELKRAKAQWRADILMGQENVMRRADNLGHQLITYGKPLNLQAVLNKIDSVNAEEIVLVARKLLKNPPTVCALGPVSKLEKYQDIIDRFKR